MTIVSSDRSESRNGLQNLPFNLISVAVISSFTFIRGGYLGTERQWHREAQGIVEQKGTNSCIRNKFAVSVFFRNGIDACCFACVMLQATRGSPNFEKESTYNIPITKQCVTKNSNTLCSLRSS